MNSILSATRIPPIFPDCAKPTCLVGQAELDSDRADLNVTIENAPSVGAFGVRSAGEGGHGPLKRGETALANYQSLGDWNNASYCGSRNRLRPCPP
jgi:hypothetical protein